MLVFACSTSGNAAEEVFNYNDETLTGDWGGRRSELMEKGIVLSFFHRSDVMANVSGGGGRGSGWLGYTDAQVFLDLNQLQGWSGMSAYAQYHSALGSKPNARHTGSFMGVDNIETGVNTAQFSQLWLEASIPDKRLDILFGLYAMDSEFDVMDTASIFIHPAFGMGAEIAQTGVNGPPVYPLASLGVRLKYSSADFVDYLQVALLDGVPGDPNDPYGTHVNLDDGDGALVIAELSHRPTPACVNKAAAGLWWYSARFDDLADVDGGGSPLRRRNAGWYLLAERSLTAEASSLCQGLAGFARLGAASPDVNQSDWSANVGLTYTGLFHGRDDDVAGIAMTVSHASSKYRAANLSDSHESVIEATYRLKLKSWLSVQPVLQRIFNPGMDSALPGAWVVGTRVDVQL